MWVKVDEGIPTKPHQTKNGFEYIYDVHMAIKIYVATEKIQKQ